MPEQRGGTCGRLAKDFASPLLERLRQAKWQVAELPVPSTNPFTGRDTEAFDDPCSQSGRRAQSQAAIVALGA